MTARARDAVVKIYVTFPDGFSGRGSGVMGDANTIFTAEHVVVRNGALASSVSVLLDGGERIETVGAGAIHTNVSPADWRTVENLSLGQSGQDYAAISLNTPLGLSTGWFDLNSGVTSGRVRLAGYPQEGEYRELAGSYNEISVVNAGVVGGVTPATLGPGYSGGPVWIDTRGEPELVGIISAGRPSYAVAADISPQSALKIRGWMTSDDTVVADAVNKANVTKIFEVGFGHEPAASELTYWAGQLSGSLTLSNAYALAVTVPSFQISLLFDSLFNRLPTTSELNSWVQSMGRGTSLHEVGASLLSSPLFLSTPGAQNAGAFIDQLSHNILGYGITGPDRDYWVSKTTNEGQISVLDAVSSSEVNALHLSIIGSINPLNAGGLVEI
ncbi:MAG: trypsin-like peptidase domain-containing protein [Patescibacteria group bacterium]